MQLFNSLSRQLEDFKPLDGKTATVYSCGPTVYDRVHIGNWRAFVVADTLRRALRLAGYEVKAAMNITDVDDKTIHRAVAEKTELKTITQRYEQLYLEEAGDLGIELDGVKTVRATDELKAMRRLIQDIHGAGYAYVADDGVYFSIAKYQAKYPYGVLSPIKLDAAKLRERIDNDEYDKADARDFALWKRSDLGEPAWELEIDGQTISGRPGWHIECSAMSTKYLSQPFDIHTGGIDLLFPHHENEIAQTKAATGQSLAKFFVHNEHLLVNGQKMSKSLNNFYTLADVHKHQFHPLSLRLLFLQSHYRNQQNFTWEALAAAENRLLELYAWADLLHQTKFAKPMSPTEGRQLESELRTALEHDLDTPKALAVISAHIDKSPVKSPLTLLDQAFGLNLNRRPDITADLKTLLSKRETARSQHNFEAADKLRQELVEQGIEIDDTAHGPRWRRIKP